MNRLERLKARMMPHHIARLESVVTVLLAILIFGSHASAVVRFQERSMVPLKTEPGVVTDYTFTFRYSTLTTMGSLELLFCINPIPQDPCYPPTELDVSNATLTTQEGETGFAITARSSNRLVLSRTPTPVVSTDMNRYVLSGIKNPTDMSHSFAARMSNYASADATGTEIDIGSVLTTVANAISFETQVPPRLMFCLGQQVSLDCDDVSEVNYSDMGSLDLGDTLYAESQMAVGTNASGGFAITANGPTMSAGNSTIPALSTPTPSRPGTNQFGMNLVANSSPSVGQDPDGNWPSGLATTDYGQSNLFTYKDGDVVASSPDVVLLRRFTVSYIVNSRNDLPAGVYTTSITYICSGRF